MRARRVSSWREVGVGYDEEAESFDQRFQSDPRTTRRFLRIDAPQIRLAAHQRRVLEVGCGTGRLLAKLDCPLRVGVDVSLALLVEAKRKGLRVIWADAHSLPFRENSFDVLVSGNGVFRYLDYAPAFAECVRVMGEGARLAVHHYGGSVRSLRTLERLESSGEDVWSVEEITRPARAAGLKRVASFFWRSLPFPPYLIRLPEAGHFWNHVTFVFLKESSPPIP